jgi:hypothetical protein
MKTTDAIATVRLVDYSPVIHAVTGKWTYCGRDAGGYVQGDGHVADVTCKVCRRGLHDG